jgi:hypothetical protein
MALQQTVTIDSIDVVENNVLQVRQRTDIFDDVTPTNMIASTYHRWTLTPNQNITKEDPKVIAIANAVWTPEVISAYEASLTR